MVWKEQPLEDDVVEKKNELVDDEMKQNSHEREVKPSEEKVDFEETNAMNLIPTTSALTCGTTDLEDIYHVTPEMENFGESKLEVEIKDIDISPIFDVLKISFMRSA